MTTLSSRSSPANLMFSVLLLVPGSVCYRTNLTILAFGQVPPKFL
jgi:hypothetical protein